MVTTQHLFSRRDVGTILETYQKVFAAIYQHILSDEQIAGRGHRSLCGPTVSVPVLPMLESKTSWESLTLFDNRQEHVNFQASKVKDHSRVRVIKTDLTSLAYSEPEDKYDLVFDPLGLQENPSSWKVNLNAIKYLLRHRGFFISASWGETNYPWVSCGTRITRFMRIKDELEIKAIRLASISSRIGLKTALSAVSSKMTEQGGLFKTRFVGYC